MSNDHPERKSISIKARALLRAVSALGISLGVVVDSSTATNAQPVENSQGKSQKVQGDWVKGSTMSTQQKTEANSIKFRSQQQKMQGNSIKLKSEQQKY